MFKDSGSKLIILSKILFVLSVIVTAIAVIYTIVETEMVAMPLMLMVVSFISSYIGCLVMNAIGEIYDRQSSASGNSLNHEDIRTILQKVSYIESNIMMKTSGIATAPANSDATVAPVEGTADTAVQANETVLYKLLEKTVQFDSDNGCRTYFMKNINTLSSEERTKISHLITYPEHSKGFKQAVKSMMLML